MLTTLATGFFGLLGTFVGGWLTYRQQRVTAEHDRDRWEEESRIEAERRVEERDEKRRDGRRTATITFVRQIDAHREACRAYWEALDGQTADAELAALRTAYLASWDFLALELSAFQLAVHPDVSVEGGLLYNAVRDYSDAVDRVAKGERGAAQHAESVQEALFAARRRFIRTAQDDLALPMNVQAS